MAQWRMWILGAAFVLAVGATAIGSENEPFEQFVEALASIREPIRWAAGSAAFGMRFTIAGYLKIGAFEVLELLEGAIDPETGEERVPWRHSSWQPWTGPGVRSTVSDLDFSNDAWDGIMETVNELIEPGTSISGLRESWALLGDMLRLASDAAHRAAYSDVDPEDMRDSLLTAYALLQLSHEYVRSMSELLGLEISVEPGESIQAAIDQAIPGTRISIIAGTYRETLEITKSITLTGGGWLDYVDAEQSYDSSVEPVASQAAILVHSEEPIDVTIDGLAIRHTELGVSVGGEARLALQNVNIRDAVTGIHVADRAKLTLEDCWFDENGVVLIAEGESLVQLDDCRIDGSTDPVASIVIRESALVAMEQTWIQRGEGSGILVSGTGSLTFANGFLSGNRGDGIVLADQASLHLTDTFFYSNGGLAVRALSDACPSSETLPYGAFTGTITGFGNSIGERASALHEEQVTCPEELEALLEAFAEDEIDSDGD